MARPATWCSTLGRAEAMRTPLPAARITMPNLDDVMVAVSEIEIFSIYILYARMPRKILHGCRQG